jgi:hypothetical protein
MNWSWNKGEEKGPSRIGFAKRLSQDHQQHSNMDLQYWPQGTSTVSPDIVAEKNTQTKAVSEAI